MTPASPLLTKPEIVAAITGLTGQLERHLIGDARERELDALRGDSGTRAPFPVLATLALLDDCLRVAHLAIDADGQVDDAELERVLPLAGVAASKYFLVLPRYELFGDEPGPAELIEFLRVHRADERPFGNAGAGDWRGIRLCREAAALSRHRGLLAEHERLLVRVMDTVFAGRDSAAEVAARRQLRELFEQSTDGGYEDPRALAFCQADGPEVFSSVAHGSQLHERDPFDIVTIHADAREVFHRQLEHAVTPVRHHAGHGRTLLVLGQAGSGKTHLMRALRAHVHGDRLGYVGYLQMTSEVGDYARYVLANLIDSLERPYDAPALTESSLAYLSDGLTDLLDDAEATRARLREDTFEPAELTRFVGGLVDGLVRQDGLGRVDADLLQAMLLLQRRDPALDRRIVKFLRCESLTSYEQELLGGLSPRLQPEDPARLIEQLGRLMFELQQAALVLLVDQVEDTVPDAATGPGRGEPLQRAFDVLRRIADAVPSSVVVISCLEDVYDHIRPRLTQSVVDRLEREPAPVRLASERRRHEVREMLTRRLEYLYDALGVAWREDEPLFPFRDDHVDKLANQGARECLAWFHGYQQACIRAQRLVDTPATAAVAAAAARAAAPPASEADLDRAWSDAKAAPIELPDDDAGLLRLLVRGLEACKAEGEHGFTCELEPSGARPRLVVTGLAGGLGPRIVEVCNRPAQGGHLGRQIEDLRERAPIGHTPVALRTSEFEFGGKTAIARQLGEFIRSGGVRLPVGTAELRAIAAMVALVERTPATAELTAWRRQRQPLTQLAAIRTLLELDRAPTPPAPVVRAPTVRAITEPLPTVLRAPAPVAPPPASHLRLGVTSTMRADPVALEVEQLKKHAAFLGTTGSGKTTLALSVIEQLLERGVSALLIDRKGDLARYADPAWWEPHADDEDAARKQRLRARTDVALYTPGDPAGRPLRLPVIPAGMHEMNSQERDQAAKAAASGLAAMMQYGRGGTHEKKASILKKAIELYAERGGGATLDELKDTIGRPDPELLAAVGNLTRHFGSLAEDLDSLSIQRGMLLAGDGDALDVEAMLAPREGRARLVVISTTALTDVSVLQFWVSRLLIELGRMVRKRPSQTLRAVAFFDEADMYIPATSVPATKEPMFDLLRRARSGGLGVLLASQNPADFDYRARDLINTWLLGRIGQDRAIEKMRNLLASYPNVAARLAGQATGCFFMLEPNLARELRADRSLMLTEQLAEDQIAVLARAGRR